MTPKYEIRAQNQPWYSGIAFMVFDNINGHIANKIEFEKETDRFATDVPLISIDNSAAQLLMDDLWHCGIRPTEKVGTVGQLKATENHLHDMQEIVRKILHLDKPA